MIETKTAAEILALNTAGQREYAKTIGVKRSASDTKATLAKKLLDRTLEIEKEQAPKTTRPAKPGKKLCTICQKRPVGSGKNAGYEDKGYCQDQGFCLPCGNECQHDIAHLNGHEAITTDECWFCHPELNQASEDYVARQGSSKAGMRILAKGTYVHKSLLVKAALEGMGATVKIASDLKGGTTILTAIVPLAIGEATVHAAWIGNGWDYARSEGVNGKKVRNLKELLRWFGIEAAKI